MTPVAFSCFLHLLASPWLRGLQYLLLLLLTGSGFLADVGAPCWQLSARELSQLRLHGMGSLI